MEDLDHLRKSIDEIDTSMVKLFLERMDIVSKVAEYKIKNSMEVLDKSREEKILNRYLSKIKDTSEKERLKEFLIDLMAISKKVQEKILNKDTNTFYNISETAGLTYKVGFQGVAGSFSHQAVIDYFGDNIDTKCFLNFKDVFEGIRNDEIKYGVLPIENSSTGGVAEVYDLLGKYNFHIVGEKCIVVEQNLLGIEGSDISTIEEVYSHAQGFLQCSEFFSDRNNWKLIPYFNTAKSAEYISYENSDNKACVASRKAAELYGLSILKENINDNKNNYTRFIIISKDIEITKECNKISVVMTLPHKVGALFSILKHFVDNNSNLVKIESRPIMGKSWEYFFYIDFNGNLLEGNAKNILSGIKAESLYFKLLGNYKSEVNLR
jgi:chorismate mutase / prephenate dehydratase